MGRKPSSLRPPDISRYSQLRLQTLGQFPDGPCRAAAPWSAAQVLFLPAKPSALAIRSSSANCSRLTGRRPRQTWNKAHQEEERRGLWILTAEEGRLRG